MLSETALPRLSSLLGEGNKERYIETAEDVSKTLLSVLIPAIVGIIVLRNEIVQLISGQEYIQATFSLALLSVALFFCFGAWFWQQCVLVPMKEEKIASNEERRGTETIKMDESSTLTMVYTFVDTE